MSSVLREYIVSGRDSIAGWFARVDAEIYSTIIECQNSLGISGSLAEIGLHHGKSFVALALGRKDGEKVYGIDIFENQQHNVDASGEGNRGIVESNLRRFGASSEKVILDARPSQDVKAGDILSQAGPIRFFSIDGGHWLEVVASDLSLAEETLSPRGVIALDDFLRPEWPDVSAGFFAWYAKRARPIVPFAIGFNKLYLCHVDVLQTYVKALDDDLFLRNFCGKSYSFCGHDIPVYSTYHLPEWSFTKQVVEHLKLYFPEVYVKVKRIAKRR